MMHRLQATESLQACRAADTAAHPLDTLPQTLESSDLRSIGIIDRQELRSCRLGSGNDINVILGDTSMHVAVRVCDTNLRRNRLLAPAVVARNRVSIIAGVDHFEAVCFVF